MLSATKHAREIWVLSAPQWFLKSVAFQALKVVAVERITSILCLNSASLAQLSLSSVHQLENLVDLRLFPSLLQPQNQYHFPSLFRNQSHFPSLLRPRSQYHFPSLFQQP